MKIEPKIDITTAVHWEEGEWILITNVFLLSRILFGKIIVDKFIARDSVLLVWSIQTKPTKQRKWESRYQVPY
jgi:hypothetical protein